VSREAQSIIASAGSLAVKATQLSFAAYASRLTAHAAYLRRCVDCGMPLGKKQMFCPRCGAKQPREPKSGEP
jgi:rRNA maturation endonuclease Nob1